MNIQFNDDIPLISKINKRALHLQTLEDGHYLYYLDSVRKHTSDLNSTENHRCQGSSLISTKTEQCGRVKGGARFKRIMDINNTEVSHSYTGQHFCKMISNNDLINLQAQQQYVTYASNSPSTAPHEIYNALTNSMLSSNITSQSYIDSNGIASMATRHSLGSTVARARRLHLPANSITIEGPNRFFYPTNGQADEGICIFRQLRQTLHGGLEFVQDETIINHVHRNVLRHPRIIIFVSDKMLRILGEASRVFADGVHKCVPNIYHSYSQSAQLYVLSIDIGGRAIPTAYILMPGATKDMYDHVLRFLSLRYQALTNTLPLWVSWMLDLENAARASVVRLTVGIHVRNVQLRESCFFHVVKTNLLAIRKNTALLRMYLNKHDRSFRTLMQTINVLGFLPQDKILEGYAKLLIREIARNPIIFENQKVLMLLVKFKRNFLENPNRPITEWCVHTIDGPRGNCTIEGNNHLFNIVFQTHPSFWQFVSRLKEINAAKETEYDQLTIGQTVNAQTRLEREKNIAIRNLKTLFNTGQLDILRFLDGMRHIYHGNGNDILNEDMEALEEDDDNPVVPDAYNHIFPVAFPPPPSVQPQAPQATAAEVHEQPPTPPPLPNNSAAIINPNVIDLLTEVNPIDSVNLEAYQTRLEQVLIERNVIANPGKPIDILGHVQSGSLVVEQIASALMSNIWLAPGSALHKPYIRVMGNIAIDIGGVWRSYSLVMATALHTAVYARALGTPYFMGPLMATYPNNTASVIARNPECVKFLKGVGRYLMLAILHNGQFPTSLAKFVIKYILREPLLFSDFLSSDNIEEYAWLRSLRDLNANAANLFSNDLSSPCPLEAILKLPPFQMVETVAFDQSFIEFDPAYTSIPINDVTSRLLFWQTSLSIYQFVSKEAGPLNAMRAGFEEFDPMALIDLQLSSAIIISRYYKSCESFADLIDNIDLDRYLGSFNFQKRLRFLDIVDLFRAAILDPAVLNGIKACDIMAWTTGTTSIPLGGSIAKIRIEIVEGDGIGPIAHTCFSQIDINIERYFPQIYETVPGEETRNYEFLREVFVLDFETRIAEWKLEPTAFGIA